MGKNTMNDFGIYSPTRIQSFCIGLARNTPILKTFFRTRLNRIVGLLRGGPIDGHLFGLKYRFHSQTSLADRKALFTPDKYDKFEREFLSRNIKQEGVFLDIGSNVGVYSLFVASERSDVKIHAFEPLKNIFECLKFNLLINQLDGKVKANNIALSDVSGIVSFSSEKESLIFGEKTETIPCMTLLGYLQAEKIHSIDAVKIDVEGAEDKVLKPFFEQAEPALWPKHIVIEHLFPEIWEWNCLAELEKRGYRSIWQGPMNTIYQLN